MIMSTPQIVPRADAVPATAFSVVVNSPAPLQCLRDSRPRGKLRPFDLLASGVVFAAFFATYLYLGGAVARTGILHYFNALFQADCPRAIADLTSADSDHFRSAVHPLFVLFFNPVGVLLTHVTHSQELAARLLCSAFGAGTVVLAAAFFIVAGLRRMRAWLWASVLGWCGAQVFWASAPETFVFAGATIVLVSLVSLVRRDRILSSVAAGVLALGVVLTNLAQVVLLFGAGSEGRVGRRLFRIVLLCAGILTIGIGLSIAQRLLYPTSVWFFVPAPYQEDVSYLARLDTPAHAVERAALVAEHMLLFNLVVPRPQVGRIHQTLTDEMVRNIRTLLPQRFPPPAITFQVYSLKTMRREGVLAALVWVALLVSAAVRASKSRLTAIQGALVLCLCFNAVLHFFYGDALFLYSLDWTFAVIASVALALGDAGGRAGDLVLGALIVLLASNDLALFRDVVGLYK